ncbi:uncharacterized protein FPOAC1_013326 [Fusarium poae]|uniref:uncharacterized protein n=1 Tax=Fusarium poae TaxID=36050 RepID=UPI001D059168|nr:uncharacterized protein FPOAC1_014092 [Fusarium poae]XP_044701048.1 uncharacterized protein FPOAC1_013326 [Fusarium poae]KAG8664123.1 hypothetical protein FPOAC1_014092 [Fusarium poae]KAG8664545.1 hypothetical protein FPOAC1_013326 [Fusarium poae]
MTSQSIPGEALNASDPSSYTTEKNSRREQPNDVTCRPVFNPATRCGAYFLPMEMPSRELFQIFLPYSLVKTWVQYTNRWVESLLQDRHLWTPGTNLAVDERMTPGFKSTTPHLGSV